MVAPTRSQTKAEATPQEQPVPRLENGDHLTRAEFERRYAAAEHIKKAELIEGVTYLAGRVGLSHSARHAVIVGWLGTYRATTPGTDVADSASVRLDAENEAQPDALLRIRESHGGQSRPSADDYLHGAPELIVEIAASSASYDLHEKLRVYRRNGVQEYVVQLALERETIWYRLNEGRYDAVLPDGDGVIRSQTFPGLWFHPERFWADDPAGLLVTLQAGLVSPEHASFVAALSAQQQ